MSAKGILKVITNYDLGGNNDTPVYPVTSTLGVYNQENKSLEDVLNNHSNAINEITDKVSDNTIEINNVKDNIDTIKEQLNCIGSAETTTIPVFNGIEEEATVIDAVSSSEGFVVFVKNCQYENNTNPYPTFVWKVLSEGAYYKQWYNSDAYKYSDDTPYINKIFENHRDKQQYYFDGNQLNTFGDIKIDEQIKTLTDGVISGNNVLNIEDNTQYSGFFMGTVRFSLPDVTDVNCVVEVWKVPVYGGGEYSTVIATQFLYSNNMGMINQYVAIPFIFKCSNPMNVYIRFKNNNTSDLTFTNLKTEIFKLN